MQRQGWVDGKGGFGGGVDEREDADAVDETLEEIRRSWKEGFAEAFGSIPRCGRKKE